MLLKKMFNSGKLCAPHVVPFEAKYLPLGSIFSGVVASGILIFSEAGILSRDVFSQEVRVWLLGDWERRQRCMELWGERRDGKNAGAKNGFG